MKARTTTAPTVKISPGKLQRIGVTTERRCRASSPQPVRAPGTIQLDERRIAVISLRAEAFVDTVENVTTGSEVRKGQPLMRLYSPAIASAAAEYLSPLQSESARSTPPRQRASGSSTSRCRHACWPRSSAPAKCR